jgi:hypothetical protein
MGWLFQRIKVARKVLDRRWVKIALGLWPILASYDLFVSQLLPEPWADRAPKMRDIIAETSGWLPWWGWVLILLGIVIAALLEYAVWRTHPNKRLGVKPPQKAETAIPIDPRWSRDISLAGALWRAFDGDWKNVRPPQSQLEEDRFYQTAEQIRQHAFDGSLPIWGRRKGSTLFEPVHKEFWRNHAIEAAYLLNSKNNRDLWVYVTHPLVVGEVQNARTMVWEDFMTSNEAVEKLWPATS